MSHVGQVGDVGRSPTRRRPGVGRSADFVINSADYFDRSADVQLVVFNKVIRYRARVPPDEASGLAARWSSKGHNMLKFVIFLQNFVSEPVRRDDRGATAVEYGLIVTLIAVVIIGVVTGIGLALRNQFTTVLNNL